MKMCAWYISQLSLSQLCIVTLTICLMVVPCTWGQEQGDISAIDTVEVDMPPMVKLVQEGEFLFSRGRYTLAIARYEQALQLGAGSAEVLNRLGEIYLRVGDVQKSVVMFKKSMRERPGQLPVYSALGEAFLASGALDSAVAYIEEAHRLAPDVSAIQSSLGFLYLQAGDRGRAKSQLDSSLLIDNNNPQAHRYLGFYYTQIDSLDHAIRYYETVSDLLPKDVEAFNNLAFLHSQQGHYSQALSYYKRAKDASPNQEVLHAINLNIEAIRSIMDGKLRARNILVDSDAQARDLLKRIRAGEDFGELAVKFSKGPNARDGGDLGFFGPGDMIEAVEDAVMKLQINELSQVIQIPQGFMIVQRLN